MKYGSFPLLCLAGILLTPRLVIVEYAGSSIRLEDAFLFLNVLWLLLNKKVMNEPRDIERKLFGLVIAISFLGLVSTVLSTLLSGQSLLVGVLFSLRPLEYVSILPTIFLIANARRNALETILFWTTLILFVSTFAQAILGLKIGTNKFSFSRASGFTGGPYEAAMVALILISHWFSKKRYVLCTLSLLVIIFSQSRISLIAIVGGVAYYLYQRKKIDLSGDSIKLKQGSMEKRNSLPTILFLGLTFSVLLTSNILNIDDSASKFQSRIAVTSNPVATFLESRELANVNPPALTRDEFINLAFTNTPNVILTTEDASASRRYFVWNIVIITTVVKTGWLIGMSPGFFGPAVDSNYVRIFAELGIVGLVLYFSWIRLMWKKGNAIFRSQILMLCITAAYIDIFVACKVIILLYVMAALNQRQSPLQRASS